jgi:hypothetical protein
MTRLRRLGLGDAGLFLQLFLVCAALLVMLYGTTAPRLDAGRTEPLLRLAAS